MKSGKNSEKQHNSGLIMLNPELAPQTVFERKRDSIVATFAKRLLLARKHAGMSQEQLADRLGIDPRRISSWERKKSSVQISDLVAAAKILDVSTDYLLGLTDSDGSIHTLDLDRRMKAIIDKAKEKDGTRAFLLEISLTQYVRQIKVLDLLYRSILKNGPVIEKTYVKGHPNICSNPATKPYVNLSRVANDSMKLLRNLIKDEYEEAKEDEFYKFLHRG